MFFAGWEGRSGNDVHVFFEFAGEFGHAVEGVGFLLVGSDGGVVADGVEIGGDGVHPGVAGLVHGMAGEEVGGEGVEEEGGCGGVGGFVVAGGQV